MRATGGAIAFILLLSPSLAALWFHYGGISLNNERCWMPLVLIETLDFECERGRESANVHTCLGSKVSVAPVCYHLRLHESAVMDILVTYTPVQHTYTSTYTPAGGRRGLTNKKYNRFLSVVSRRDMQFYRGGGGLSQPRELVAHTERCIPPKCKAKLLERRKSSCTPLQPLSSSRATAGRKKLL